MKDMFMMMRAYARVLFWRRVFVPLSVATGVLVAGPMALPASAATVPMLTGCTLTDAVKRVVRLGYNNVVNLADYLAPYLIGIALVLGVLMATVGADARRFWKMIMWGIVLLFLVLGVGGTGVLGDIRASGSGRC